MSTEQSDWPKVGAIVSFDATADSVALMLPSQLPAGSKLRRFAGIVTGVAAMTPYGPSQIKTAAVTVRGRTNKSVTLDGVACDLKEWPSWTEADKACKDFNA